MNKKILIAILSIIMIISIAGCGTTADNNAGETGNNNGDVLELVSTPLPEPTPEPTYEDENGKTIADKINYMLMGDKDVPNLDCSVVVTVILSKEAYCNGVGDENHKCDAVCWDANDAKNTAYAAKMNFTVYKDIEIAINASYLYESYKDFLENDYHKLEQNNSVDIGRIVISEAFYSSFEDAPIFSID